MDLPAKLIAWDDGWECWNFIPDGSDLPGEDFLLGHVCQGLQLSTLVMLPKLIRRPALRMGVPPPPPNFYISPTAMAAMNGPWGKGRTKGKDIWPTKDGTNAKGSANELKGRGHESAMFTYDVAPHQAIGHPRTVKFAAEST